MKKQIEDWLLELSHNEVIPENIVALNFGIFESENGYCVYLIGSESYDADDDDWACDVIRNISCYGIFSAISNCGEIGLENIGVNNREGFTWE